MTFRLPTTGVRTLDDLIGLCICFTVLVAVLKVWDVLDERRKR